MMHLPLSPLWAIVTCCSELQVSSRTPFLRGNHTLPSVHFPLMMACAARARWAGRRAQ